MPTLLIALLMVASLGACGIAEQRYVIENEAIAMTEDTAPAFVVDDDNAIFLVERRFQFPIEPPGDQTLRALKAAARGMMLPFPRHPWVSRNDLAITLDYVLANLEDRRLTAGIVFNGANEFFEYAPGPQDFSQWERRFELKPKQRVRGHLTELDLDEIAVDLATVVNGAPNSNQVVQFQSQSGRDPRVQAYIPKVIPGLIALRAGVLTDEAANVVLEISVRIEDRRDRLAARGDTPWRQRRPMLFTPVLVAEEP